jgi:phosphoglycerol transferase
VQVASFSQLLYTMQVSMGGAGNTIVQILQGFFEEYSLAFLIMTLIAIGYFWLGHQVHKNRAAHQADFISHTSRRKLKMSAVAASVCACAIIICQLRTGYDVLGIEQYIEEQNTYSSLYEIYYVKPDSSLIQVPEKKKNLIYIYMESMESTYANFTDQEGNTWNYIPELAALAKEGEDFTSSESTAYNGGKVTNKASWTIAGITAQTSGTPLGIGNSSYTHNFDDEEQFMPNLVTLGDILEEQGYHNVFMCGSQSEYGGRKNYFEQHGNYEIFDVQSARDTGKIPQDYNEWWGFEDEKLVEYAKEKITELANSDQPFNFTMLTADTHFKDGYLCKDCPDTYDEQYLNVLSCSSARISEFVEWIQQQDFYEDTVVILAGDHLTMDGLISATLQEDASRQTYFTVLNGPEYTLNQDREFTTFDIFPTTLEAMGFQIENGRLGLGTSLYSSTPTLCEELGFSELNSQIAYRSAYYEEQILAGDDTAAEEQ